MKNLISSKLTRLQLLKLGGLAIWRLKASGIVEVHTSLGFVSRVALDRKWVARRIRSQDLVAWMLEAEQSEGQEIGAFDIHIEVPGEMTVITFDHESSLRVESESEEWVEFLAGSARDVGGELRRI